MHLVSNAAILCSTSEQGTLAVTDSPDLLARKYYEFPSSRVLEIHHLIHLNFAVVGLKRSLMTLPVQPMYYMNKLQN
jgi:hypothetical protein